MMRSKLLGVMALSLLVVGCSSNSKKELPPADLPDFEEEVGLKKEWSRGIGSGQGDLYNLLVPAIDGDRIFAADSDGDVVAMDRFTGKVLWKKELDKPVSGGVGAGEGLVLVGTLRGDVIALDAASGERRWKKRLKSEVLSAPVTNGRTVVVQTQDDNLVALDATTGEQRWIYENSLPVLTLRGTSDPVITRNLVIAGLASGKVVALDVDRGLPLWEQRVAIPQGRSELERVVDIDGNLVVSGSTLYVVSYQGRVAALDLRTGQIRWQREASSYSGLGEDLGSIFVSQANGTVEAIDDRTATALWSQDALARRQLSAPTPFSTYLAVGDFEGYLHLISQVDGRFVGRTKIDGDGLRVRALVKGDWLYAFGNGGELVALTLR